MKDKNNVSFATRDATQDKTCSFVTNSILKRNQDSPSLIKKETMNQKRYQEENKEINDYLPMKKGTNEVDEDSNSMSTKRVQNERILKELERNKNENKELFQTVSILNKEIEELNYRLESDSKNKQEMLALIVEGLKGVNTRIEKMNPAQSQSQKSHKSDSK